MKPFDLEAAKRGEPICTRAGEPAKFIAHVPEADESNRVVVLVGDEIFTNLESGSYYENMSSDCDLFMASKKRTVWLNLYLGPLRVAYPYDTEIEADQRAAIERIGGKAWPLEIEE